MCVGAHVCVCVHMCVCLVPTSPAAANKAQVVEARHPGLGGGRGVPQLGRVVLVVPRHHRHQGAVGDVAQGNHLQGSPWQRRRRRRMERREDGEDGEEGGREGRGEE